MVQFDLDKSGHLELAEFLCMFATSTEFAFNGAANAGIGSLLGWVCPQRLPCTFIAYYG